MPSPYYHRSQIHLTGAGGSRPPLAVSLSRVSGEMRALPLPARPAGRSPPIGSHLLLPREQSDNRTVRALITLRRHLAARGRPCRGCKRANAEKQSTVPYKLLFLSDFIQSAK